MSADRELLVDEGKIRKAVFSGIPLTITTFTLPREIEVYIEQVITVFLKQLDREMLKDYVVYCVKELAVNAKKANTKRVYFSQHGLQLSNSSDYKEGMANFKKTTLENIAYYLQLQKEKGLYIKVVLQMKNNIIYIEVRNNTAITKTELIRIHDKLARARKFNSMEEALAEVMDDSEGAGLGLVILILMLKKIGLDEDCFEIVGTDKETVARLTVPLDKTRVDNISDLSSAIADNISSLPQFPENILLVQRLINNPKSEMADIARQISMDPALTADILKIVNSAQYMLAKKVDSISDAVKMVGIRGIKNLLYSYGTQKVLGDDTKNKKILWEHSYKTAFYAFNLVKNFHKDRNLLDDVYVGGMLHDMGKIIFSSVHPELLGRIQGFCAARGMPASTFEDFAAGTNHAEIGALVAEKWNFPEAFVACIRYHHNAESAPKEYQSLVDTVYLANTFCLLEDGEITFDQVEGAVLERFGLNSKQQVDALLEKFSAGFTRENQK
ncbi:MAG: HDOD domain-containing protein [Treponema sp.]|nr:HDOD domain-containing protein [Treponema sp.]